MSTKRLNGYTYNIHTRRRSSSLSLRIAKRFIGVSLLATVFYRKWNRIFFTEIFFLIFPLFWKSGISNSCSLCFSGSGECSGPIGPRKEKSTLGNSQKEREKRKKGIQFHFQQQHKCIKCTYVKGLNKKEAFAF